LNGTAGDGKESTFSEIINYVDSEIEHIREQAYIEYPFLKDG